jgi:hypothetical protein
VKAPDDDPSLRTLEEHVQSLRADYEEMRAKSWSTIEIIQHFERWLAHDETLSPDQAWPLYRQALRAEIARLRQSLA